MLKKTLFLLIILFLHCNQALSWPIPDSGQTKCYDNEKEIPCPQPGEDFYGQDGNYIINPPSYTKLDEKGNPLPDNASSWVMVKDNVTGLIWEKKTDDGSIHDKDKIYNWEDSQDTFIKDLNVNSYAGFRGWRLPSIEELTSIVIENINYYRIDTRYFSNVNKNKPFYWSSTSFSYHNYCEESAWQVVFVVGNANYLPKTWEYSVRAVRGVNFRFSNHLLNNRDGTITDKVTGLMWQIEPSMSKRTWVNAIKYCNNLYLSNFSDW